MPKIAPVSYKILNCIFELAGFKCVREEGDHLIFTKPDVLRPVVIPKYRSIPVFIIKNNLRTSGMTRERYFELFKKCS
jgi:predicted RNA binding protein YcfA (HicA-like mRNA interferase family)